MYGCESWTIKEAEWQRIDAFELLFEKILECPLKYKEIKPVNPKENQSWILTARTDAETEAPMLWPPDRKNSLEKILMLGKIEGKMRRERQEDEMVGWHPDLTDVSLSKLWEMVKDREALYAAVHGVTKSWTQLSDRTVATLLSFQKDLLHLPPTLLTRSW